MHGNRANAAGLGLQRRRATSATAKKEIPYWEGGDPPSGGRVVYAAFRCNPEGVATDYDRACDMLSRWLGLVDVGSSWGLVLGGEPTYTTWCVPEPGGNGMLARIIWADEDDDLRLALSGIPDDIWTPDNLQLTVLKREWYLFDAALHGRRVFVQPGTVKIELPPGTYSIQSAEHRPDQSTYLLLHRFVRVEG